MDAMTLFPALLASMVAALTGLGYCALPAGEHIQPVHTSTHAHAAVCRLRREPSRRLESLPVVQRGTRVTD